MLFSLYFWYSPPTPLWPIYFLRHISLEQPRSVNQSRVLTVRCTTHRHNSLVISFVIHFVFTIIYNEANLLSNTTKYSRNVYYFLLHGEQLHVSALDNGDLQVVHESLSRQLYKHIYIYIYIYGLPIWRRGCVGVKWARDLVSVRTVGTCVMYGGLMLLSSYV